jgi:hypothetical protein
MDRTLFPLFLQGLVSVCSIHRFISLQHETSLSPHKATVSQVEGLRSQQDSELLHYCLYLSRKRTWTRSALSTEVARYGYLTCECRGIAYM